MEKNVHEPVVPPSGREVVATHTRSLEAGGEDLKTVPTVVDGTTQLFADGQLRLVPRPTHDLEDPLNFSRWKKGLAITSICFFGAIALAMQQIIAGMSPVFMLEYAGIDPNLLNSPGGLGAILAGSGAIPGGPPQAHFSGLPSGSIPTGVLRAPPTATVVLRQEPTSGPFPSGDISSAFFAGPLPSNIPTGALPSGISGGIAGGGLSPGGLPPGNPLEALSRLPGAQPLSKVNLLVSFPTLIVGLSNYVLVPASVAFGRRPVMLVCGFLATFCALWAGLSKSLSSHLAARCFHAIGAGAVESLIALILQDMTFLHQRSRAFSVIWASQGILILALGISSSYIVARISWRWLYFIGSIITAASLLMMVLFLPETRWYRTPEELRGEATNDTVQHIQPVHSPDERRQAHKWRLYGLRPRGGFAFRNAFVAFLEIIKTLALPIVIYMVLVNAAFIGISLGTNLTITTVLLAPPYNWPFDKVGFVVLGPFLAAIFVMVIGGFVSDRVVNSLTKRNHGKREAEMSLWNLVFPMFCGVLGCLLYGVGGEYVYKVHWMAIFSASVILIFAFSTANIIASVVVVESYPRGAGAVLVNVASFRNIVGFAFLYGVSDWIAERGYMVAFAIFAGVIAFLALFLPFFMIYGKRMRKATSGITKSFSHSL